MNIKRIFLVVKVVGLTKNYPCGTREFKNIIKGFKRVFLYPEEDCWSSL
jgi:hypothetical protein